MPSASSSAHNSPKRLRERAQPRQLLAARVEGMGGISSYERGEPRQPSIGDAANEVLVGVNCLGTLHSAYWGRRSSHGAGRRRYERLTGVGEQQPRPLLIVWDHLGSKSGQRSASAA